MAGNCFRIHIDAAKQLLRRGLSLPPHQTTKSARRRALYKFTRRGESSAFYVLMKHSREYRLIARRLIQTLPEFDDLRDADVKIAYLSSQKEKTKNHKIIFAECCKVEEKYEWCCKYDFFIIVYEPNVTDFTNKQKEILIRHELHHVGIEYTDNGIRFYVAPHDVEEFWEIIKEHGLDWSEVNATR